MMPSPVAGSRLPVGSSARRISGRLTKARAMDTRCCSPPESWFGKRSPLSARPADHFQRERDVLGHRLVQQQLVVLEDVADLASQLRDLALAHLVDVLAG